MREKWGLEKQKTKKKHSVGKMVTFINWSLSTRQSGNEKMESYFCKGLEFIEKDVWEMGCCYCCYLRTRGWTAVHAEDDLFCHSLICYIDATPLEVKFDLTFKSKKYLPAFPPTIFPFLPTHTPLSNILFE